MSLKVAVLGATGHLGRLVVAQALAATDLELVAGVGRPGSPRLGEDLGQLSGGVEAGLALTDARPGCFADAQVVIDVSLPEGLVAALAWCGDVALVTGTTGLHPAQQEALQQHAQRHAVLQAANFSTGVALLRRLAAEAARRLPDYDVEIIEAHHRRKRDAPSGTAAVLASDIAAARALALDEVARHGRHGAAGPRSIDEIGIHAVRGGDIVGEHTVLLAGEGERVTLGHIATSRTCFATGALHAARWLAGRGPGLYDMADVVS